MVSKSHIVLPLCFDCLDALFFRRLNALVWNAVPSEVKQEEYVFQNSFIKTTLNIVLRPLQFKRPYLRRHFMNLTVKHKTKEQVTGATV